MELHMARKASACVGPCAGDGASVDLKEEPAARHLESVTTASSGRRECNSPSRVRDEDDEVVGESQKPTGTYKSSFSGRSQGPQIENVEIGALQPRGSARISENLEITANYEILDKLGEGGYGQVYKAQHRTTGMLVAVKRIPAKSGTDIERYERELKVFERMRSPYLVSLHEICRDQEQVWLVMSLCAGGDLMDYLTGFWSDPAFPERQQAQEVFPSRCQGLPWGDVCPLLWQMLAGVAYLHHHGFVHRDVKLENFMLATRGAPEPVVQLCDFGLSVRLEKGKRISAIVGTPLYMAPEVFKGSYAHKADVWSVGVCSRMLMTGRSPWGSMSMQKEELQQCVLLDKKMPWPKETDSQELKKLTDQLMSHDEALRPTVKEVFATSAFLRKYRTGGNEGCLPCLVL